jgi:hypothetical protein
VATVDVARRAIQEVAAQVMTGRIAPVEGARQIAAQADRLDDPGELACFADLARRGDDEAILEQASLLLADTA